MIRAARVADVAALREIERAAGEPFRAIGLDVVADDDPPPAAVLAAYVVAGRAWVAERSAGGTSIGTERSPLVGYLIADLFDGCAHVEQVSVLPSQRGRRIGEGLVEHLAGWARDRGLPALTLTTYRDVPWNGPYWARLGFRELIAPGPGLRAIREHEAARGLDVWPRLAMRRELAGS
ncbi:GNAT family N-acetyltransferase [Pseudonocardia sp. HH130629-09]|uniref:GNAT family N-acetyltransferase n=1 Tax=Pseudonocardia sp. HH130629-09 TaxID=1641402 RepID=UPI0006CB5BBE|nr:GNAT family N-acetyltransferase [Pseudonocardia sp. HH130629-09]ALE85862.1 GCN5 family acetyltransferase [Pseudonocardia sp. HH130629-09]